MNAALYARVKEQFLAVLELPPGERARHLEKSCGHDAALRDAVERLVAAHDDTLGLLSTGGDPRAAGDVPLTRLLAPPERVAGYRIVAEIGRGGMGVVYEAEQESPRRKVALKLIRPELATPGMLKRFEYEAEVLGRLQHPGIAQIFEAGTDPCDGVRRPFLAMELVRGEPLGRYLERADPTLRARVELWIQICDAVAHAHQNGVIHRDLKPGNILVAADSQPKVLDFGVARLADADLGATGQTQLGELVGTLPYMSPEQVAGDPRQVDLRSDVYALGVVGFGILTGELPYVVPTPGAATMLRAIREDEPRRASTLRPELAGDLDVILAKALCKERDARYASAAQLADDLRAHLSHQPIAARPATAVYRLRKFARRHTALVVTGSVATVLLIAAAGVSTWLAVRATRAEGDARRNQRLAEQRATQAADAQRRAERQTELAEGMNTFLSEFISSPDAISSALGSSKAADARISDLLDHASQRAAKFTQQPELESRIRMLLGRTYRGLGRSADAEREWRRALELLHATRDETDNDLLTTLNNLALIVQEQGRLAEAEPLSRDVLERRRKLLGEHRDTITSAHNHAQLLLALNRLPEAETLQREALAFRQRTLGEAHPLTVLSTTALGLCLRRQGRLDEAEQYLRVAADASRRLDPAQPYGMSARMNLAALLRERGQREEALMLYRDELTGGLSKLDPSNAQVLSTRQSLAALLIEIGQFDEAEAILIDLIAVRRAHAPNESGLGVSLQTLADLLLRTDRADEAEPLCREALEQARRTVGESHRDTLNALSSLGRALQKLNRLDEALAMHEQVVAAAPRVHPPGHWMHGTFQQSLGICLQDLGRFDEAERAFCRAYELIQRNLGSEHTRTRAAADGLVKLYQLWDQPDQVRIWQSRAGKSPDAPSTRPVAPPATQPDAPPSSQPDAPPSSQPDAPPSSQPDAPPSSQPDAPPSSQPDAGP
ncbi:MAG: Serine/threonine-protein kinase PknD [Phycisphaerae bacterium]|nr:Serine/threonine-protein kinase PknD [Phycisphaerae bacterium]